MNEETKHLSETLVFAIGVILEGNKDARLRIARAYLEAQQLVAEIPLDNGDARPRIVACLEKFNAYKAAEDVACAGWMLAAIRERVNELNLLPGWMKLRKVIDQTIRLLPSIEPTLH